MLSTGRKNRRNAWGVHIYGCKEAGISYEKQFFKPFERGWLVSVSKNQFAVSEARKRFCE
jgi:hypothetical protein